MRVPRRPMALLCSTASGLLLAAAGEPVAFGPLAWVALVPLFWAVYAEPRWRWSFLYGLVAAVAFFGIHLVWIFLFGWMAWTALTAVLSLYVAAGVLAAGITRRWPLAPVLAAGAWAGMELLRDRWPFGGYSWGSLGTSQAGVPGVRWLAGVVGVYGLSFLAAFVAAFLADRLRSGRWAWGSLALVAAVTGAFVAVDLVAYGTPPEGRTVRVAVIQGNVPRPPLPDQRDRILANHIELTHELVATEDVDVVVWPEDAIGITASPGALDRTRAVAREIGTPMLVGNSNASPERGVFFNDVDHLDVTGEVVGKYRKRHPVPFGEYVPLTFLRRFVTTLEQVPYDLERGDSVDVFEVDGIRIGTPICFESVFPRDVRDFARQGAELQIVTTNNASFEGSWASDQHLAHGRMRALELRQWVVQAALSGISGVAAPDGSLSQTTGLFEPAAFVAEVQARPAASLYARTGDLYPAGWAAGTLFALLLYGGMVAWSRVRDRSLVR